MGNSLTRLYGAETEPPPQARRPSRRSRRSSDSTATENDTRSSLKSSLRNSSDSVEEPTNRRCRRSTALRESTGSARQAADTTRKTNRRSVPELDLRTTRELSHEPRARTHSHRSHKAERHHHSSRTSAVAKPQSQLSYADFYSAPRSPRNQRYHQKEKTVHVETIELEDRGPKKECMVCAENRPVHRFAAQAPTAECAHEVNTCRRCLRKWIQSSFKTKLWDQINCPECGKRLQFADVQEFASPAIFKRYDELATRAALEAIPEFRWCVAKGCKSGQVHEQGNAMPQFKCVSCKASHCVVHGVSWHKGETCAEYDYRTDGKQKRTEEAASKKWIKEMAKKCPNCKRNIQKASGCDHMTCSKCRHEFCWQCLAPFNPIRKQGNQMHRASCEYYDDGGARARA